MEGCNTMDHKIILKCRLCLDEFEEGKMFDLFAKESIDKEDVLLTLHEKVEYCCGVRIRESIEMPSKICTKCNEMTKIWFNFRQMCINSQVYLESLCKERSTLIKSNKDNYLEYVVEDLQTFRSQARKLNNALTIKLEALVEGDDMEDIFDDEEHDIIESRGIINEDDNDVIDDELDHDYNACKDSESYTDEKVIQSMKTNDTDHLQLDFKNVETDCVISSSKTVRNNKTIPKKTQVTIKKSHKIPTPTSYMCSICGNVYTKKNSFKYHMSLHSDIKPHECELCGKSFRHVSELKSHMRRHTGEKPYKCSYCERHFVDRSERHRHERVHTNTRPYACNICGKRFTYSVILKNHLKYHSGVKDFNCLVCDKSFTLPHQLKAHLQTLTHKQKEEQFVAPYDVVYEGHLYF